MFNKLLTFLAFATLTIITTTPSHASLIGDSVQISWDYPAIGTQQCAGEIKTTTVTNDASDTVTVLDCFAANTVEINMNGNGVEILINQFGFDVIFLSPFDGIVITGLDWSVSAPTNFAISTNLPGWNDSAATLTDSSWSFNFANVQQLDGFTDYSLTLSSIPVSSPTMLVLFALIFTGLVFKRR